MVGSERSRALADLRIELLGGFRVTVGTGLVRDTAWRWLEPAELAVVAVAESGVTSIDTELRADVQRVHAG